MITLLNSFGFQTQSIKKGLGENVITNSFSYAVRDFKDGVGENNFSTSFSLAHGNYTVDGVILPNEVENSLITRIK